MLFIYSIGIFSDRETLELLAVSLSFEDLLPRLAFTWFCFICGTVQLFWVTVTLFFYVWTATDILQFSSGTFPLNFVWLSRHALSLTTNLLVFFYSHITVILHGLPHLFPFFLGGIVLLFFVSMSHRYPVCLHYFCGKSHMHGSFFFVWMLHKYTFVSITSGH